MSGAYYNEIDPYAAQWLRNLIAAGHIGPGDVDERSIVDVRPSDLRGYTQAHFFAGVGGWSQALRIARWPDSRAVWTGSCPCQPFSLAGRHGGTSDDRHLWPAWFALIAECRPPIIFGEQVAAAVGKGWLDAAFNDLEGQGYACGAAVLPACAVGAPHIRDRLWFVANADSDARHERRPRDASQIEGRRHADRSGIGAHVRNADRAGLAIEKGERGDARPKQPAVVRADWWATEPDVGRVAHGVPARVGKLRALGNAIVPQVAAEFISACR